MWLARSIRLLALSVLLLSTRLAWAEVTPVSVRALAQGVALDQGWVFRAGDDPSWALPQSDDSDWLSVDVNRSGARQAGLGPVDVVWYRTTLHIDDDPPDLGLLLGPAAQSWTLYANGQRVGRGGYPPPSTRVPTHTGTVVDLPDQGGDLVLAVRLAASPSYRQLYGDMVLLRAPRLGVREALDDRLITRHQARLRSAATRLPFIAISIVVGLYNILLWAQRRQQRSLGWFGLFAITWAMVELLGLQWFQFAVDRPWVVRRLYSVFGYGAAAALIGHLWALAEWTPPRWMRRTGFVHLGMIALELVLPGSVLFGVMRLLEPPWYLLVLALLVVGLVALGRALPHQGTFLRVYASGFAVTLLIGFLDGASRLFSAQTTTIGPWLAPMHGATLPVLSLFLVLVTFMLARQHAQGRDALARQAETLQRLDQLKDEFIANTSHELRTPLNGIIGITESLAQGVAGPLPDTARRQLQMVAGSGKRLASLLGDLLDFSRMRHQDLQLRRRPVDLHSAVDVVLTLSRPTAQPRGLTLTNDVPRDLPPADADEDRIQQVLHNLVGNAIKFTQTGGVRVEARRQGQHIGVSVIDTGIGIAKEAQERIFDVFVQADGSVARVYGGTGLGLTITRKLVELHGGELTVESAPGQGSRFSFTLPVSSEEVPVPPLTEDLVRTGAWNEPSPDDIEALRPTAQGAFRVLVVDDEPVNLQVLDNYLSTGHFEVHTAADGPTALRLVEEGLVPDAVVLDVMMPHMSGYEVCSRLRQRFPAHAVPIVLLTARTQLADLLAGFEAGANDYLTKPVSQQELLARLGTHLHLAKINMATSRFVPFEILNLLGRDSVVDVALGDSVAGAMTVLFSDIRKFTTLSEGLSPEDNFRFINEYLSRMEPEIHRCGGFIDKYIGDAIMALFPSSADDALNGALGMQAALDRFNHERAAQGLWTIDVGIGLNTGPMMLGMVGGRQRMEGTVISDSVNLASRVEGMTKLYGARVLITQATRDALVSPERYALREVDRVTAKGKHEPVTIYEVIDGERQERQPARLANRAAFNQALHAFQAARFDPARAGFAACLQTDPHDRAAALYVDRCDQLKARGVTSDWDGVTRLEQK